MSTIDRTLRRFPAAAHGFAREIFDGHWGEASWLYERRDTLREQQALVSSEQWEEIEARAEAHVEALSRGGSIVLGDCERRSTEGDPGELHTAVRLLCRGGLPARLPVLLDIIDWSDPLRAWAVTDALLWDAPDGWQGAVGTLLGDRSLPPAALDSLITVAGLRRWALHEPILALLEDPVGDPRAAIDAAARLGITAALPRLAAWLNHAEQPELRGTAAKAALRFDHHGVTAFLEQVVGSEPWAAVPLALGGKPGLLSAFTLALESTPQAEILLGLGLYGHADAIDPLLEALGDDALAPFAAEALDLLTGAELHEETTETIPAEDQAEPRSDQLQSDQPPGDDAGPGGEPEPDEEGEEDEDEDEDDDEPELFVVRPSCDREQWSTWLREHRARIASRPSERLRLGMPFHPYSVLDALGRTMVRAEVRDSMADELEIRLLVPPGYCARLLVARQREALRAMRAELERRPPIDAGAWYVAGHPIRGALHRGARSGA